MAKKITDWDLYMKYASQNDDKIYWYGTYQNFNGLDAKNTKNMIFVDQANANSTNSQSISYEMNEDKNIQDSDSEVSNHFENGINQVAPEIDKEESDEEYVSAEI